MQTANESFNVTMFDFSNPILKQTVPIISVFVLSYFVVFAMCVVGNVLVCFVVLKIPRMRNVTNFFILNLSVSDLLVSVFCMPFTLVDNIIKGWPFGDVMCKLSPAVQIVSVTASVFTLVAIALDRYYAIIYPTEPKFTIRRTMYVIAGVWILAIIVAIPQILLIQEGRWPREGDVILLHLCEEPYPYWRKAYTTVLFGLCYICPLLVIMYLYVRIGYSVWIKPTPGGDKASKEAKSLAMSKKVRVIKMLLTVVILFTISWLPIHVITMINDYATLSADRQNIIWVYIYPVAHWLIYFNSSVNPIIYGYFNQNFRTAFKTLLLSRRGVGALQDMSNANGAHTNRHHSRSPNPRSASRSPRPGVSPKQRGLVVETRNKSLPDVN
ncbi:neuropeptide FF receptor 2-like [Branchiostoma floridae]|uniref:Neuropeptide FF receptor 1 n=1 Tax=Branchiostoma floridae TaxID=7739 RepID=A0A9J7KT01_BRAFL|nr:neuropeptide FF receptor 2-like [Branchiostoma floridae]XP_035669436.1 neuropeptide FF receptor 2-like [Branchiostoma floridae]